MLLIVTIVVFTVGDLLIVGLRLKVEEDLAPLRNVLTGTPRFRETRTGVGHIGRVAVGVSERSISRSCRRALSRALRFEFEIGRLHSSKKHRLTLAMKAASVGIKPAFPLGILEKLRTWPPRVYSNAID